MGTGGSKGKKASEADDAAFLERKLKGVPVVRIPAGRFGWKEIPFLPENFLEADVWQELKADAEGYGASVEQLNAVFHRMCSVGDVSFGTVPLRKFFREFDPRFRNVLRRLVLADADGHSRMLFEDVARFVFKLCAMDFHDLVLTALAALRDFPMMNVVSVRAVVRYLYAQGAAAGQDGLPEFLRMLLSHLHTDESMPFHKSTAFVQLAVRYPALVYPVILMQRSIQRRFFGIQFWKRYHEKAGTALFPSGFSRTDSELITSRVIALEAVSTGGIPFRFGTGKTVTRPPRELTETKVERAKRERDEADGITDARALQGEDSRYEETGQGDDTWGRGRQVEGQRPNSIVKGQARGAAPGAGTAGTNNRVRFFESPAPAPVPGHDPSERITEVDAAQAEAPVLAPGSQAAYEATLRAAIDEERARLERENGGGEWGDMADVRRIRAQAEAFSKSNTAERTERRRARARRNSLVTGGFGASVGAFDDTGAGRRASMDAGVMAFGYADTAEGKAALDRTGDEALPGQVADGPESPPARRSSFYTYNYEPYFNAGETEAPLSPGLGGIAGVGETERAKLLGLGIATKDASAAAEASEAYAALLATQGAVVGIVHNTAPTSYLSSEGGGRRRGSLMLILPSVGGQAERRASQAGPSGTALVKAVARRASISMGLGAGAAAADGGPAEDAGAAGNHGLSPRARRSSLVAVQNVARRASMSLPDGLLPGTGGGAGWGAGRRSSVTRVQRRASLALASPALEPSDSLALQSQQKNEASIQAGVADVLSGVNPMWADGMEETMVRHGAETAAVASLVTPTGDVVLPTPDALDLVDKSGRVKFAAQGHAADALSSGGLLFGAKGGPQPTRKTLQNEFGAITTEEEAIARGEELAQVGGFTANDTRTRAAAFGFSALMGHGGRGALEKRLNSKKDHTLPIPHPGRVAGYLKLRQHPTGAKCALPSLAIARLVLAHSSSGAGAVYGIVIVPCLLCQRHIQYVDEEAIELEKAAAADVGANEDEEVTQVHTVGGRGGTGRGSESGQLAGSDPGSDPASGGSSSRSSPSSKVQGGSKVKSSDVAGAKPLTALEQVALSMLKQASPEVGEEADTEQEEETQLVGGVAVPLPFTDTHSHHHGSAPSPQRGGAAGAVVRRGPKKPKKLAGLGTEASSSPYVPSYAPIEDAAEAVDGYKRTDAAKAWGDDAEPEEGMGTRPPPVQTNLRAGGRRKAFPKVSVRREQARHKVAESRARERELSRRVALVKEGKVRAEAEAEQEARLHMLETGEISDREVEGTVSASTKVDAHTANRAQAELFFAHDDELEDEVVKSVQIGVVGAGPPPAPAASADAFTRKRHAIYAELAKPGGLVGLTFDFRSWFQASTEKRIKAARKAGRAARKAQVAADKAAGISTMPAVAQSAQDALAATLSSAGTPAKASASMATTARSVTFDELGKGKPGVPAKAAPMSRKKDETGTAKSIAANTGFCGACDAYLRRLLAHEYGYKIAGRILDVCTVRPSVEDDLMRHSARARAEKQPLMKMDHERAAAAAEEKVRREALILSGGAPDAEDTSHVPLARKDWAFPDDKVLELWDEEAQKFFYHNVTTGDSSWFPPPRYVPYVDPEAVAEEEIVRAEALVALAAAFSAERPSLALGQSARANKDEDDDEDDTGDG